MRVTSALSAFVAGLRPGDVPEPVREQVRRAFLDTLGVALAGAREPCARITAELARKLGAAPEATLFGHPVRTAATEAALVNGTAAHALDYDDVSEAMMGHPSAPLVPAVMALAEQTGASGEDAVVAYAAGFEVQARVGRMLGPDHYARGWHPTSTLGTLGAAAAASRILGSSEGQTAMALGVACSLAAGCRQQFGTMTKPLHAGIAARNGIMAALLAADGLTADATAIEGPLGFGHLYGGEGIHEERGLRGLGDAWLLLDPGIGVKKYPCCYATHCALDAALELRSLYGERVAAARAIQVVVPTGALAPLIHDRPSTGLEGKFSMPYCVAAALTDGHVRLATFSDEAVRRPAVREFLERVEVREAPRREGSRTAFSADVLIDLGDVRVEASVDTPRGDPRTPLSWQELVEKFRDCAAGLPPAQTERALTQIERLDRLERVADLAAALGSGS